MDDWHAVHIWLFAIGGAAIFFVEVTALQICGRITRECPGIWQDRRRRPRQPAADRGSVRTVPTADARLSYRQ